VREAVRKVRTAMEQVVFLERAATVLGGGDALSLAADEGSVRLWAEAVSTESLRQGRLMLKGVGVVDGRSVPNRRIRGGQGLLIAEKAGDDGGVAVAIDVRGDVEVRTGDDPDDVLIKGRERIEGLAVGDVQAWVSSLSDRDLLTGSVVAERAPLVVPLQKQAVRSVEKFVLKASSEIHSRLAFSVGVLVLVVLGAGLGVIFRGSQVMVAFGISFVPALFVTVMNIMGRQLAEKPGTTLIGLAVIWGAIAAAAVAGAWTTARVIRR